MTRMRVLGSLLLVLGLAGCATTRLPAHAGPQPDDNLNAVAWTQTSVEHDLIYRELFRIASERLAMALADPGWDALPPGDRDRDFADLPPAVIVDVDETMLDNMRYQARLVRDGRQYDGPSWDAWCEERAATALPGAAEFARKAAAAGVTVFYVTNRGQTLEAATLDNLRATGFPVDAGERVFLGQGMAVDGCEPAGRSDKSCRRRLVGRSHRVLLQIGDQLGDFVTLHGATPAERRAVVAPFADWFGQRWLLLPNPTYGSWESVLARSVPGETTDQRRAQKLAELSY